MNTYTLAELTAVLREDILHADNRRLTQDYVVAMREAASELNRLNDENQKFRQRDQYLSEEVQRLWGTLQQIYVQPGAAAEIARVALGIST